MHQVKLKADVTNTMTGERLHRVTWSRDGSSITVYTNFGVWAVFTGERAQMVNQMFMRVMNEITVEVERHVGGVGVQSAPAPDSSPTGEGERK